MPRSPTKVTPWLAAEPRFELVDLVGEGGQVARVAPVDLNRARLAARVGQQAHHQLFLALFAVAAVAPVAQGVVPALQ
jgi:hypothetical protein